MRMIDLIENKKNGKALSEEEIHFFAKEYLAGNIPDYQVSALLMTICFNGMNKEETNALTNEIIKSGDCLDLSAVNGVTVDKHSTGGVGDKTTLIVTPIVAALGYKVSKMSGRGLGFTGGTADKLEAIPGYQTVIPLNDFVNQVNRIGISLITQSGNLTPLDKKLYALRDVTATVNSIPLIASSIMGKKIAMGAECIVLDVKTGSGALISDYDKTRELATTMVDIGKSFHKKMIALITDMDIPLGNNIGNSLEVIESVDVLKGQGPEDLKDISMALASNMVKLASGKTDDECKALVLDAIYSGKALAKFKELILAQGGDPSFIDDYSLLGQAQYQRDVYANHNGYISHMETNQIGEVSVILGAGREKKDDVIDYTAGITIHKKTGDYVTTNDVIATLYTNQEEILEEATKRYQDALAYSNDKVSVAPLIKDIIA